MGCHFELIVVEENEAAAQNILKKGVEEIQRLEELLSEFKPHSDTSLLNNHGDSRTVAVDPETYALIARSKEISHLTQGAFDITIRPLKKLYSFKNKIATWPSPEQIYNALEKTGYQHLQLEVDQHVSFRKKGMQISFAAIGKGYAADAVIRMWKKMGVKQGVVNASGDLTAMGNRADGSKWKVGIAHPDNPAEIILWIPVREGSVATSGDYEQYFIHEGIRYSHNINPLTGYPLNGIKSVTVISPSAELCDALCTAVSVMGTESGLHFINQLPQTHCLIIDEENRFHFSKNLDFIHD